MANCFCSAVIEGMGILRSGDRSAYTATGPGPGTGIYRVAVARYGGPAGASGDPEAVYRPGERTNGASLKRGGEDRGNMAEGVAAKSMILKQGDAGDVPPIIRRLAKSFLGNDVIDAR
jgi:hypothetical protein